MAPERSNLGESRLRLQTVVRLRWVAIAGQIVTVLGVYFGFGFPLPLAACFGVIAVSAALNIVLRAVFPRSKRFRPGYAAMLLGYDLLQLSALLCLTGGLQNPFALLIVVPVAVSASALPVRHTVALGALAVIFTSILAIFHWPLPWAPGVLVTPFPYMLGVWIALVLCIAFTAVYARSTAEENRQMYNALAATEMLLARQQQLSALNSLAAAAAHELGTPLSTIYVVTKELERETEAGSPLHDDILLLRSQAVRCRGILGKLAENSAQTDAHYSQMTVRHVIEEVIEPLRLLGKKISVNVPPLPPDGYGNEPILQRNPGVMYALTNLVENAVDYAASIVEITADWDGDKIRLLIADDGPGFAPNILERLGEPYVTTRGREKNGPDGDHSGMGLGIFIAKTLLERDGAVLTLGNRRAPETGALASIVWSRSPKTD